MSEEKKPFERLPTNVVPRNYNLELTPDLKAFNFKGRLEITVEVRACKPARPCMHREGWGVEVVLVVCECVLGGRVANSHVSLLTARVSVCKRGTRQREAVKIRSL